MATHSDLKKAAWELGFEEVPEWIREKDAARVLHTSEQILAMWRKKLPPPIPFFCIGRAVRYRFADVLDYQVSEKERARTKKLSGWIYIITTDEFYPVCKIGYSLRPPRSRLQGIQVSLPFDAYILHEFKVDEAKKTESRLHETFKSKNLRGEWFRLEEGDFITIKGMLT